MRRSLLLALLLTLPAVTLAQKQHTPPPLLPPKPVETFPSFPTKPTSIRYKPLPLVTVPETTGIQLTPETATPAVLDGVAQVGFRRALIPLDRAVIETQRGSYDFTRYNALVAELKRRKLQPLFTLSLAPPAYPNPPALSTADGRAGFAAFAQAAVQQYRNDAKYWVIGSSSDLPALSSPGADYSSLVTEAGRAMKQAHSRAQILAVGPQAWDPLFYQRTLGSHMVDLIEGVMVLPPANGSPESWRDYHNQLSDFIQKQNPGRYLSIWVSGIDAGGLPGEEKAAWLVRRMLFNYGQQVPATFWNPGDALSTLSGGAAAAPDRRGPEIRALEFMNRYLAGTKLKRTRELPDGLHGLVLTGRGKEIHVLWSSRGNETLKVRARKGSLPTYNLYGEPQAAVADQEVDLLLTGSPIYIEGRLIVNGS